jgi:O-antigen ligase
MWNHEAWSERAGVGHHMPQPEPISRHWTSLGSLRRLLLAVILLGIPLPVGMHLGYRDDMGELGSLGGLGISLTTLALIGLYAPFLIRSRYRASLGAIKLSRASAPLAMYLTFAVLSLFSAADVTLALYEIVAVFQALLVHVYIVNFANSREDVVFIVRYLLIGLAAEGALMIALAAGLADVGFLKVETRIDPQSPGELSRQVKILGVKARLDEDPARGRTRVGGAIGSPNDAAGYLSAASGIAFGILLTSLGRSNKLLAGAALGFGAIALVLTFSRGGWMSFVLIALITGLFSFRRWRVLWKPALAGLLTVVVAGVLFGGAIQERLTEDDKGSARSRVPLMKIAALVIMDHPLLGVGANNFPLAMEPYVTRGFIGEFLYTVHCKYLLVWSETGPGALLAFLWFLGSTLRRGIRCWRCQDPLLSPLAVGCSAAIVGLMFHMMVDIFRGQPTIEFLCVIAALVAVSERLAASHGVGPFAGDYDPWKRRRDLSLAVNYGNARKLRFI